MSKYLTDEERDFIANFQDDFLGFEDDIPSLLRIFEAFLRMCRKAGIMLNPAKIRIGIRKCKFYGFILSKKGMEPSEKNLDPVKKMTTPKNSSEVRSILGVFNQFRHFFKRYDRLVLPLQKLLRKNEPFVWSKEASYGLEVVRAALLSGELYLAAPDPSLPLILETDGSDDGWGAILLQIIKGMRRVIKMWSKQWKTLHMKRSPPYYKETAAWMNGLEKSRIYIDYSQFPVKCITDHIPLTYVKNTSGKGPVSQFVLDNLSSLDYTIEYREGSKLVEADGVSRFPCLGPRELSPDGVKEAFNILLASLPNKWTSKGRVWVHAQKETEIIQQLVREWLSLMTRDKGEPVHRVPYTESVTADRIRKVDYSIALWAPPADNIAQIVNEALTRNIPFACLLPSCLINLVPNNPINKKALDKTIKIVLLRPEVTWILHKIDSVHQHQVYSSWLDINTFGTDQEPIDGIVRPQPKWNFEKWSAEQEKMIENSPELYPENKLHRRVSDGFVTFTLPNDITVALVPEEYRSKLIIWQHQQLCHSGDIKVYNTLKKHWYWPDLKKQTRTVVRDCAACQLLKAKRARAHRHFRAKVFCTPRTSWGCDFYGVGKSDSGHNNVLGAMDFATATCRLFATKCREAPVVQNCILHGIVLRDGCPLHIHSDAAREFISKAMRKLCEIIGCKQTTTLAHHPTGNSHIERLWQYVARCLKLMSKAQYKKWERYIRLMEHVWNVTYHSVLKCTPFEAAHGLPARGVLDTYVEDTKGEMVDLMTADGIEAMQHTAKAFEKQIYQLRKEAAERQAMLARKGARVNLKVGDEVSLFLPPSEREAAAAGRKVKHLLFFRGPAIITKVLSNTTYQLDYKGRVYFRCFAELRPYKSSSLPVDLPIANEAEMQDDKLISGNFVTLCDTDDRNDDHFHLCKVIAIEDEKALLLNYATWSTNLRSAKFKILYQEKSTNRYTTQRPARNAKEREVIDKVPMDRVDDYIDHYNVKLTKDMRLRKSSIRQLKALGLKHHVLGKTFP
jgi:transposase InsO family protein